MSFRRNVCSYVEMLGQCLWSWAGWSLYKLSHSCMHYSDVCSHLEGTQSPSLTSSSFASYLHCLQCRLVKFSTQSLFALKCQPHGFFSCLCNTLIYALYFFFFAWALVSERGFIFASWKDSIQMLDLKSSYSYGLSRSEFFIWQRWCQQNVKSFSGWGIV